MCAESLLSSEVMKRRSVRPIREREEREERERGEGGEAIQSDAPQHPRTEKKVPPLFQTLLARGELIGVFLCCSESHSERALGHLSADTFPPEARTPPRVCVHRTWISSFGGLR